MDESIKRRLLERVMLADSEKDFELSNLIMETITWVEKKLTGHSERLKYATEAHKELVNLKEEFRSFVEYLC